MLPDVSSSTCARYWFFFRRALESMHNNFAIYCGLAMLQCCRYIGLECTILFFAQTHSAGCRPLQPLMIFTTKPDDLV